jgi:multiple sugar transport system substrate-binding protein
MRRRQRYRSAEILLLAFLGIAVTAGIPGCSKDGTGGTEIVFWAFGAEGEHVAALLPEFEAAHPGVHVRIQIIPWTAAHEKLLTAYAGSSTPDLCQLGNTWIPEFRLLDAIAPLDDRAAASSIIHRSGYFDGIWATNVIDTVLLGIPWYVDTRVMFYRADLLAKAGYREPPRTWAQWEEAARALVAQGGTDEHYAMLLPTSEWAPPVILGLQAGSDLLKDGDTKGNFSGSTFGTAFDFYLRFFHDRLAPVGVTRVTNIYQGIAEGFFSMYITGPWNIGEFRRRMPDSLQSAWMTMPLPSPDTTYPGASLAGGSSLVLFKKSKHPEIAWQLIEFLSRPEQQVRFYHETGDLPARVEAWEDTAFSTNKYIRAFRTQLTHVVPTPRIPEWEQIAMKVQDYADLASRGLLSSAQARAALDKDVDVILEKRRWMIHGQ